MDGTTYRKLCIKLHDEACKNGDLSYHDPLTSLSVFTELYLQKRPCCESGCRHCPYGFNEKSKENV